MPKSRIRKKADFTPPPTAKGAELRLSNRNWVAPVMLAMFLVGLAWIVLYYVTGGDLPVKALGGYIDTEGGRHFAFAVISTNSIYPDINGVFEANDDVGKIVASIQQSY